ncbi:MAG: hypothetical protein IJS94_03855 [Clostridia bacterium]|nr:hypothetical protein [Clostridia bacterium]
MISTDKSILIIGAVLFVISAWFFIRPGSGIHMLSAVVSGKKQNIISFAVIFLTVAVCTLPMGLSPYYNGEIPAQRDQYEETARAFLDGRLYIDNDDIDEALLSMENPYDPDARDELGVYYEWDHALYNGHYYMYFGVVPVLLLFLPFRAITGSNLTTYHATQIFAALFSIGLF